MCNFKDPRMSRDLDAVIKDAITSYGMAASFYKHHEYADVCFQAYHTVYCFLKAYTLMKGLEPPNIDPLHTTVSLLDIATSLDITYPDVLNELMRLEFIHIYFDYPDFRVFGDIEFHENIAMKCLKSIKVIAYRLFKLRLPALPLPSLK